MKKIKVKSGTAADIFRNLGVTEAEVQEAIEILRKIESGEYQPRVIDYTGEWAHLGVEQGTLKVIK